MTTERLAALRFLANFAAYHVPGEQHAGVTPAQRALIKVGDAGDDMLELCDAIGKAPELLASCKELREALAGAMRVIAFDAENDALTEAFVAEMARLQIPPGIGVRAEDAIAQAEGKPRPRPIDLEDLTL